MQFNVHFSLSAVLLSIVIHRSFSINNSSAFPVTYKRNLTSTTFRPAREHSSFSIDDSSTFPPTYKRNLTSTTFRPAHEHSSFSIDDSSTFPPTYKRNLTSTTFRPAHEHSSFSIDDSSTFPPTYKRNLTSTTFRPAREHSSFSIDNSSMFPPTYKHNFTSTTFRPAREHSGFSIDNSSTFSPTYKRNLTSTTFRPASEQRSFSSSRPNSSAFPLLFKHNLTSTTFTPVRKRIIKCNLYCCSCFKNRAMCIGRQRPHFNYLPELPPNIRHFRMMAADLRHLTRRMIANLSNFEIITMNLTFNNISSIDRVAFVDLHKLEKLDLSWNPIPAVQLREALSFLPGTKLKSLSLAGMQLTSLWEDFFDMFSNMTFKTVDLQQNRLETFNNSLFLPFRKVETVFLSKNAISRVVMSAKVNIGKLVLRENKLSQFPDFCLHYSTRIERAFYNLRSVHISNNPFDRIPASSLRGECLPHLIKLDISWSRVTTLENNFVADLHKLEDLMVNQMSHLSRYEPYAFNSTSLRNLHLNQNQRIDSQSMDVRHVFRYCPKLEKLNIVDTKLEMTAKNMWEMLVPLKSVKQLNLQRTRMGVIPPDLLWRLPNLKKLIFTGSHLNSYGLGQALINVTSLEKLNVQANSITVVNESTLPWEFRESVKWIDMSQNPFTCTCDLLWFRRWLDDVHKNNSTQINNFPSKQYRCSTPANMKDIVLSNFHPTPESCAIRNPYILIGSAGGSLLAGLLVLLVFTYRYRWYIRFYIYRLRRRQKYERTSGVAMRGCACFPFDVYVAHSAHDLDWIKDELLPLLEDEHGLKVFLEERDGMPGSMAGNVIRDMDLSARVCLVISDDYNREGFRQWEFENILYAAIEQQKDVIVVLLGDVESGRMTKDMRRMLTRGTFLQWESSEEVKSTFREGLSVALLTQNVNFIGLC